MTLLEVRAMLRRCDPRKLREDAGIAVATVTAALGVPENSVRRWEARKALPTMDGGFAWARFTAGLERHAEVTAEIAAEEREAA